MICWYQAQMHSKIAHDILCQNSQQTPIQAVANTWNFKFILGLLI